MVVVLLVIAVVGAGFIWIYNALVGDRNQVKAAWSDIDVQLVRRHDLLPQLVTTVKAYAAHEKATLLAVTELRTRSEAAKHLPQKAAVEAEVEQALHNLIVVAEAYPQLKADQNFLQLQRDLVAIEDHIQYARRFYNGAVRIFNTRIQSFPHLLLAQPMGFKPAEYFEVDADQRGPVKVELS
jgi:LemA protein